MMIFIDGNLLLGGIYQIRPEKAMQDSIDSQDCECDKYERRAFRGFEWLEALENESKLKTTTGFKTFTILNGKNKWKKKNSKTFAGLDGQIEKVIKANSQMKEENTRKQKHELFLKSIQEIHCRNEVKKINKVKGVDRICEREKELKRQTIQSYFQKEEQAIITLFDRCFK